MSSGACCGSRDEARERVGGLAVARIEPGATFTSAPLPLSVAQGAPDDVVVRLVVDRLRYRSGTDDEVVIQGIGATRRATLVETPYAAGAEDRSVRIQGRAVSRRTGAAQPGVPVELVLPAGRGLRIGQITGLALTACMAYVDLNPIRAGIADELADSDYTTIQRRLRSLADDPTIGDAPLEPMAGVRRPAASSLTVRAYIDLVDCTGRITRPDKRGAISDAAARALDAIRGTPEWWVGCVGRIEEVFATAVGSPRALVC